MPESATIGAVVERLRSVDPDLTVSKVRYLETRGLIDPERSDRGTRRFDEETILRLAEILRLQREEYLPLDVIRRRMMAWDAAAETALPDAPITATELAERTGVDAATIADLTLHGLLREQGGRYGPWSVRIALGAAALLAEGLEPRHLRLLRSGIEQVGDQLIGTARALGKGASGERKRAELVARVDDAARTVVDGIIAEEANRLGRA
jgi:DNA-binding transcriptional MerR regulator